MLRRVVVLVSVLSLPGLAATAGCRPSKAELVAVQQQLAEIRAEQERLSQQLATSEEVDEGQRRELARLDAAVAGVTAHVVEMNADLEEQKKEAEKRRAPAGRPDPKVVYKVTIDGAHTRGSDDALVTIVAWTDFQCPYCSRVQSTLRQIEDTYGREVRFVHKNNPLGFHPRAMDAALAAEAAGRQGKFWKMHDKLFANQKQLTDENFRRWAKKLGLDVKRFERDLEDPKLAERIREQQAQGMTLGARGTPAFFVNGRFLSGAQPFSNFEALIEEELTRARRLVRRGVPRREVYETTIADGHTKL